MAHSSRQVTRLSALGITRWRRRGAAVPSDGHASPPVAALAVTAPRSEPQPRPVVAAVAVPPEPPPELRPAPAADLKAPPEPAPPPQAMSSPPRFTFECVVLEDHLLLADRLAFQDGQGARAQLAEAADALRVLYLQSHGVLPKAKAQRHQFVWPQLADGGLDHGQAAAEAALLGYVGRVLADKGRLLVLTPPSPGEAVAAQLAALERQLPQARLCKGIMPALQADPAAPRQALWTQLLSRP